MFLVAIFFVCDSFKNRRDLIRSDIPNSVLIVKMQISLLLSLKCKKSLLGRFPTANGTTFHWSIVRIKLYLFWQICYLHKKNIFVENLFACTAWWNTHWIITKTQLVFLYFFNNLSSKPKQRMKPPISKTPHNFCFLPHY